MQFLRGFPLEFAALFDCIALGHQLTILLYLCIPPRALTHAKHHSSSFLILFLKRVERDESVADRVKSGVFDASLVQRLQRFRSLPAVN
jgi:hypothetical protein